MVYKRGKLKGQLTTAEIRKLISAHNKLSKVTIPPRSTREEILALLDKNGFSVDHEKELLVQKTAQKMDINLEKAKEITKRKPRAEPTPKAKPAEVLEIEDKAVKKPKSKRDFKINRSERKKRLGELIDDMGGRNINLHKVLGMKPSEETPELVKQKCRELRLKFHPDKSNEPDADKFDLVQKVCKILLDTQEIKK
jgi:hypothetical protein